jgi:hypothetical protein
MVVAATQIPPRTCSACGRSFSFAAAELRLFEQLAAEQPAGENGQGWRLPTRCSYCRQAARAARHAAPVLTSDADEWLTCLECGDDFQFGGRDRDFFASRGFAKPKRCRPCRIARRS